jgi:voltage-dependent potassium channel beta subunit
MIAGSRYTRRPRPLRFLAMIYRRLGRSGLKLSALSFGAWITFGTRVGLSEAREMIALAYDRGVNFFDNAEVYARGEAERIMGRALAELRLPRDAYCVSSKAFWGAVENPRPTQHGLSRKHLIEACHEALVRLGVDHLDLYFCHRHDPDTPVEEVVLTMDLLVRQGKVLYWGTSEWPPEKLEEACRFAARNGLVGPQMEQPQYNLLHRERVEREYAPLIEGYGLGLTTWSPLASGLLTGKYLDGVPADSRLAIPGYGWLERWVFGQEREERLRKVRRFVALAKEAGIPPGMLAIAWCLRHPAVSTVILGASRIEQLQENLDTLARLAEIPEALYTAAEAVFAGDA